MPCVIPFDNCYATLLCVFKPHSVRADDLVDCLVYISKWFESTDCVQSSILKSIHGNMVMWCGSFRTGPETDRALSSLPSAESLTKAITPMAEIYNLSWYDVYCGETKNGIPAAKISRGDAVIVRALFSDCHKKQEDLCYACLAISKSMFSITKGVSSFVCFKSLDENLVVNILVWEDLRDAYTWVFSSAWQTCGKLYTENLIVDTQYDILKVVYATGDDLPHVARIKQPPVTPASCDSAHGTALKM